MPGLEFRYVGKDSLPTRLSEFDVDHYFALTDSDVAAINQKFRRDGRAGAAIQLVFLRASGHTLDQLNTLPRQLLRYIGARLGVPTPTIASLRTIYQRYKTLYEHQVWACDYLGLTRLDGDQWTGLEAWMRQDATESLTIEELLQHAYFWLYERRILIPSTRALQDIARSIWAGIERELLAMIEAVVPLAQIAQAEAAVFAQHATSGTTVLEWLKTPLARHSPSTMTETLAKIHFLKALGADRWAFDAIPIEKQRAYGQRIQARRPAKVRELKTSTRTIELVFFLRVSLLELTDAMAYQSGRRVSDLVRRAYNKTTAKQLRSAVEYRQQLLDIKALVDDTRRSAEDRLADIGKLLEDFSAKPPASHAASVREMLTEDQHRIRNLLTALRGLEFATNGSDPAVQQLEFIGSLHDQGATELPPDCQVPVSASWRDLVNGEDRQRAMRAMEASAMMGLRRGLRRGTVWINHSLSFRERDQLLIPPAQWDAERDRYLSSLGLPNQADTYLDPLMGHLKAGLAALDEAREAGHFTIDADGVLHQSPLEAADTDATPARTRDLLFKDIGNVQFADMILEMDARTNFSEVLLARKARDAHELIALYAGLLAHGTELDAKGVAAMIPRLDPPHVSTAMRALEMPGRLRRANERVVEFQRTHAITELWGTGQLASSDSMSLDTSPHLFYARADPRRRTHAVGVYTHVLDQHGIVYNQPMVLNERQTGVAIEGVMRHNETRTDGGCSALPWIPMDTRTWGWRWPNCSVSTCVPGCATCQSASCTCRAVCKRQTDWPVPSRMRYRSRRSVKAGMVCCAWWPPFTRGA